MRWLAAMVVFAGMVRTDRAAAEPPCRLVAQVSGDPAVVPWVTERLIQRRVPVSGAGPCGGLRAVVSSEEDGRLRVSILLDDGRTIERIVDDVDGAATSIESWSRNDVSDPLLAAHLAAASTSTRASAAAAPPARGIELAATAAASLSSDGAIWPGAHVHGCVHVGALCVGALVGYARDSKSRGDSAELDTSRAALDLMLMADLPLVRGQFTLTPGAALGQRSLHITRSDPSEDDDRMNHLLVRAHFGGGYRLASRWTLEIDGGVDYLPSGEARLEDDEGLGPPLAGAPPWQVWLGFGVSYGGL